MNEQAEQRGPAVARRGTILLEVIFAVTLFVSVALVVLQSMNSSVQAVGALRMEAQAADLAVTILSEMRMGMLQAIDTPAQNFQEPQWEDWTWKVATSGVSDVILGSQVKQVEVTITNTKTNYTYRLARLMSEDSGVPSTTGGSSGSAEQTGSSAGTKIGEGP